MGERVLPNAQNTNIIEIYDIGDCIGQGGFSKVYVATERQNGLVVAIKQIEKFASQDPQAWQGQSHAIRSEVGSLSLLKGAPHIVDLLATFEDEHNIFLVLNYIEGSSELFDILCERSYFPEKEAAAVIANVVKALNLLHTKGVVHRDIKSENIMAKHRDPSDLFLIDFGLSAITTPGEKALIEQCGSPGYVAPEVLLGLPYGMAVDMWSLGVTSYILMAGFAPWDDTLEISVVDQMVNGMYDFPQQEWGGISDVAKDFVCSLLNTDPDLRMTAAEAVHHPFISYLICPFPEDQLASPNPRMHVMQDSKTIKVELEQQLKKVNEKNAIQVSDLAKQHQIELDQLKAKFAAESEALTSQFNAETEALKARLEEEAHQVRSKQEAQVQDLQSNIRGLKAEIQTLQSENQRKEHLLKESKNQGTSDDVSQYQDEIEDLKLEVGQQANMITRLQRENKQAEDISNAAFDLAKKKEAERVAMFEKLQKENANNKTVTDLANTYKTKLETLANHFRKQQKEFTDLQQLRAVEEEAQLKQVVLLREKFVDLQQKLAQKNFDNDRLKRAIMQLKGGDNAQGRKCPNAECGALVFAPGAKFCAECGEKFQLNRQHIESDALPDFLSAKPTYPARGRQSRVTFRPPTERPMWAEFTPRDANLELKFNFRDNFKMGSQVKIPIEVFVKTVNGDLEPAVILPTDLKAELEGPERPTFTLSGSVNKYSIKFKPTMCGLFILRVTLREERLYTAKVRVTGATGLKSFIEGGTNPPTGPYTCRVVAVDDDGNRQTTGGDSKFQFRVESPQNSLANFQPSDNKDGTYSVNMELLKVACDFFLYVQIDKTDIVGSPFHFRTQG